MNNNSFHLIIYVYWGTFICLFILLFVQTSAEGSCRFFPTSFAVFIHHWRWVSWRIRASKKRRKVRMTISMPHWTRCCCPVSSNVEEIKNTPFFKFFKCFSPRLERQPGLNVSLRASSLGARDSTRDSAKGIRNPASSPGRLWGRGTAPGILLKESGITVALRGCLGAGTAGFSYRNPQSRELPGGL